MRMKIKTALILNYGFFDFGLKFRNLDSTRAVFLNSYRVTVRISVGGNMHGPSRPVRMKIKTDGLDYVLVDMC